METKVKAKVKKAVKVKAKVKKAVKVVIPPIKKYWTLEQCREAICIFGLNTSNYEKTFKAWHESEIPVPANFPGRWYVLRMVRRADTRLKK